MKSHFRELKWLHNGYDILFLFSNTRMNNTFVNLIHYHTCKEHCHNHIIFCAVDNVEHKKYNDCKRTYRHIRNLSDELCREHGLSVIIPAGQKGMTHYEWQMAKSGTSWKAQMNETVSIPQLSWGNNRCKWR